MDFQKNARLKVVRKCFLKPSVFRLKQLTFYPAPFKYDELVKSKKMPSHFSDKESPFFMQMVYFE